MEKTLLICLKLNFTPNTLGCHGLKWSCFGWQGNAGTILSTQLAQLGGQVQGISLPARKLYTEDGTEIVESDAEMVTIQGEDGVVYQVQGELEDGTQTLLVQGEDGEQRCVYVTTNEGVEGEDGTVVTFSDPAFAGAVAQLDPSQVSSSSIWVAIIKAKFQIRQRRYHQCSKPPNFKSAHAATNLT